LAIRNNNFYGISNLKILEEPIAYNFKVSTESRPLEGLIRSNVNEKSTKLTWRLERNW